MKESFIILCLAFMAVDTFAEVEYINKTTRTVLVRTTKKQKYITSIEASGALYLEDLERYLVISDDTEKKAPVLYLINSTGNIERTIMIEGLDEINDMESITGDSQGRIYIATSQSINKKGNLPQSRKLFIRVSRQEDRFELDGQINLIDRLEQAALESRSSEWSKFITNGIKNGNVDIEGIFYQKGAIFLGFKEPHLKGKAVIIKIDNIDGVFKDGIIEAKEVSLWRKISLKDGPTGVQCGISDMMIKGVNLYILTCAENAGKPLNSGGLWKYNVKSGSLSQRQTFDGLRPEGITFNSRQEHFLITFDNGEDRPSQIMIFKDH